MKSAATVLVLALMLLSDPRCPAGAPAGQGRTPSQPFSIQRLTGVSDPVPGGGTFLSCGVPFCAMALSAHHPLSDSGEVSFTARTEEPGCGGQGIYLTDGKTTTVVASSCIPTPFGNLDTQVGPANLNDHG